MEFRVYEDIEVILTLLDMTIQEFANELGVSYSTVSRWKERGETVSPANLEKIYEYAFKKRIRLNKIKEQLFREECLEDHALLFHGAKTDISVAFLLKDRGKTTISDRASTAAKAWNSRRSLFLTIRAQVCICWILIKQVCRSCVWG